MAASPRPLEGAVLRKVNKMLNNGADSDDIASMLVKEGWLPEVAKVTAEQVDRDFQNEMRETNMATTHAPRNAAVRTGGTVVGALGLAYLALKLFQLVARLMVE